MRPTWRYAAATAILATAAAASSFGGALADDDASVDVVGGNSVNIGHSFKNTFHFDRHSLTVRSGDLVTWRNDVDPNGEGEPHTITIAANKDTLPSNIDEVFNCGGPGTACEPAQGHVDDDFNPIPGKEVLNAGPEGLDEVGDSLLLGPNRGDQISAKVSASKGTTLYYLCAVHPWMQGKIRVR